MNISQRLATTTTVFVLIGNVMAAAPFSPASTTGASIQDPRENDEDFRCNLAWGD
jgi:hypothetical protein